MSEYSIRFTPQQMMLLANFVTNFFDETKETLEYGLYSDEDDERCLRAMARCLMEYAQDVGVNTIIAPEPLQAEPMTPQVDALEPPLQFIWARLTPEQASKRPPLYCEDCEKDGGAFCSHTATSAGEKAMEKA